MESEALLFGLSDEAVVGIGAGVLAAILAFLSLLSAARANLSRHLVDRYYEVFRVGDASGSFDTSRYR